MDPRDRALQAVCPTVIMPRYGTLPLLPMGSRRFILASNGIFIEARGPILHARANLAPTMLDPSPFGPCKSFLVGFDQPAFLSAMRRCIPMARRHLPREWAAVLLDDPVAPTIIEPEVLSSSSGHIRYDASAVEGGRVWCDVHSHGRGRAYFSDVDDADDRACASLVRITAVIGCLDAEPELAWRVVVAGHLCELDETGALARAVVDERVEV